MDVDFDKEDNPMLPPLTDIVKPYAREKDLQPVLDSTHDILDKNENLPDSIHHPTDRQYGVSNDSLQLDVWDNFLNGDHDNVQLINPDRVTVFTSSSLEHAWSLSIVGVMMSHGIRRLCLSIKRADALDPVPKKHINLVVGRRRVPPTTLKL